MPSVAVVKEEEQAVDGHVLPVVGRPREIAETGERVGARRDGAAADGTSAEKAKQPDAGWRVAVGEPAPHPAQLAQEAGVLAYRGMR